MNEARLVTAVLAVETSPVTTSATWGEVWQSLEFATDMRLAWMAGIAALTLASIWLYRRDAARLHPAVRGWLLSLRVLVLLTLLVVALAPQERKSQLVTQPSRVAVLVDQSMSMSLPSIDPTDAIPTALIPSRSAAVQKLLLESNWLASLRERHEVSVYGFGSTITPIGVLRRLSPDATAATTAASTAASTVATTAESVSPPGNEPVIDWAMVLRPQAAETRLGESLLEVHRRESGETLSGIVVLTDGRGNAGVDSLSAAESLADKKSRLVTVGVGSQQKPVNLRLGDVQAPTLAHMGDKFSISAFVLGQGLAGQAVQVELLSLPDDNSQAGVLIESRNEVIREDGSPAAVQFEFTPSAAGRLKFLVRARLNNPVDELLGQDNEAAITVDVVDRKLRVLVVASGPMRDYQFVRNLLYRDRSVQMDVYLQSATTGASQESARLLTEFPATREKLFEYDAILAFDANWTAIASAHPESLTHLSDWVYGQSGGLVLIAGDVHLPRIAAAVGPARESLEKFYALSPVVLDSATLDIDEDHKQPWPVQPTREGAEAGFLQLTDDPATSAAVWGSFPGMFKCFPTKSVKAGATVYAWFSDPRMSPTPPPLFASQFFGSGRVFYIGSPELWLLRALDEDYFDRFWVKLVRESAQGRLLRGATRGVLLLEAKQVAVGASVAIRGRLLDQYFGDLIAEQATCDVTAPDGRPVAPPVVLRADKSRPGQFVGSFVAAQPGVYRLELPIPESDEVARDSVVVRLPNLEFDRPEQDVAGMRRLSAAWTGGGAYLPIDRAGEAVSQLPDKTIERRQFETPRPLWDQASMMYWLVGLLAVEWITRKIVRLA
jgi:hypothetical protein